MKEHINKFQTIVHVHRASFRLQNIHRPELAAILLVRNAESNLARFNSLLDRPRRLFNTHETFAKLESF